MVFVLHNYNGAKANETLMTGTNDWDEQHSQAQAGSCFEQFSDGQKTTQRKNTDDKVVMGYTHEYLPFQIIVDGFFGGETLSTHQFIDEHVTPLIDQYTKDLQASDNPELITQTFIKTIYRLRQQYAQYAEFTMSIAVTYEKQGQLLCSGFGIGDTAIAVKRVSGEIEQLVTNNEVNKFKDAFDGFSSRNIDLVISRNSVFTTVIKPGDELVGYTYLHEDLEDVTAEFTTPPVNTQVQNDDTVKKYAIKPTLINPDISLFDNLTQLNQRRHLELVELARAQKGRTQFGDDAIFGQIIVPSPQLQTTLIAKQYGYELDKLKQLIDSITDSKAKQAAIAVREKVELLQADGASYTSLNEVLFATNDLLQTRPQIRQQKAEAYKQLADNLAGHSSLGWKLLGVVMVVLGAALSVVGAIASTIGLGTAPGIGLAVGGGALATFGVGFFIHGQQKGLAKSVDNLADMVADRDDELVVSKSIT